ncbi:16S rRNA (guanine(527)-N(7))-methyltransferase RsmG [Alteromonas sp. McT4-15]|jgi:16S rRNA (guanine527-N7)-methyltransferase|uniref:16S rRNA (guanine(527)-N(7))-methyltransferase RsmG n=1 Tax=unclassified Alteromonas TaxID=2614992 RepID=UPI001920C5AD|nr:MULTISPECIES: 16S rRNA (guanine(527)-N(7))-methyltransferase RsmG [unclassified Alteromonas]MEC8233102.1 16S rRNA (guanine(527)-N(7))-methyltransferase RsmG [Pseudomonadota bacterium]MCB4437259.1 16S rRNA (guanine(527)-N(7))-methyltransferase RsmG [Alteromonas sp. McT4-15]WDT86152.1 16S rRNA (guanine(527)-N(7))-methyltransferase RsmG [Alteromonas sp. 009811495]BCO21116.1 ribosomal RNA small subunit methyltransferase G [Alteromonas sp. KC3]BCO25081.1 ribosomal RNA small subunit methyltransfe
MSLPQELHTILTSGLAALSLELSDTQQQQLVDYVVMIDKWNKAYNLTSVRDPKQMMVKHILDSLAIVPHLSASAGENIIDVGTGPGLPGMPLAIAFPNKSFTLLDSLGKRVRFMTQCVHTLKLTNVTPVQSRVEEHNGEKPYDIVLSRAFASLKDMLHWCEHLVDSDGQFLALKGQFPQEEIDEVSDHFQVSRTENLTVPNLVGERHLVWLKKK